MAFLTGVELETMMVEIAEGVTPENSSLAPLSERQRGFWDLHEAELLEAQAAGREVIVSHEWPDIRDFREGFVS